MNFETRPRTKRRNVSSLRPTVPPAIGLMYMLTVAAAGLTGDPAAAQSSPTPEPLPKIVNGLPSSLYPSVVALIGANNRREFCTGTLIGCETVLTAAHCVCSTVGSQCQAGGPALTDPSTIAVFAQHGGVFPVQSIAVPAAYVFGWASDVAVLKLGAPVEGIAPTPINSTQSPPFGTTGTIVGFGITAGNLDDNGIKRRGEILTSTCAAVPNATHVCWAFTTPIGPVADDSNTCSGDSGGPLFVDFGAGDVVAGVTSGGVNPSCLPNDQSFDTDVFVERAWIRGQGGADLDNTACGDLTQAGQGAPVSFGGGTLDASHNDFFFNFPVPAGASLLRLTLNGEDGPGANPNDFDLYVKLGGHPSPADFDCRSVAAGNYEICDIPLPAAGTWWAGAHRYSGAGAFQVTGTVFGPGGGPPADEPFDLFFHGPGIGTSGLAVRCLDEVPAWQSGRPTATIGSGDAWFETRRGSQPSVDCVPPSLPARLRAGTKFSAYIYATLVSDFTQIEYVLEVIDPGISATTIGRVTQKGSLGWNRVEFVAAAALDLPAGAFLRLKVDQKNTLGVLRFDLDHAYSPTGGVTGPQGYSGMEILEPPETEILVGSFSGNVLRYNGRSGAFFDEFIPPGTAGLDVSLGMATGPDGHLYVSSRDTDNVLKFHGATGQFLGRFNPGAVLNEPTGLTFGPDGNLYVGSAVTNAVLRFNVATGRFIDVFANGGPLDLPEGVIFGPDGHLYVSSSRTDSVLRYDGRTGAFIDVFATGGGLDGPAGLVFGSDGNLYVASIWTHRVVRYDGRTGAFIDVFASGGGLDRAISLQFGPDGHLYVVSQGNDRILRFDGKTGAFIDVFAQGSGFDAWTWFIFRPDPNIFADGFENGDVSRWSSFVS